MNSMSHQNDLQTIPIAIRTFVFFDLETTGFIQGSSHPKITEISLIALSRHSLLTKDGSLPRVMHKLTIPIQPMRPIPIQVSQITGLYNDLLEDEKPFDEQAYELLNSFIRRLCPPICFVAHNGAKFDYPILLSALNCIGKTLSEDILSIDSLIAFRTLFSHDASNDVERRKSFDNIQDNSNFFVDDGCDAALAEITDRHSDSSMAVEMEKCETDAWSMQKINETTPTHQINRIMNRIPRKLSNKINELSLRKRLPFQIHMRPDNFKLDTIYKHLVGVLPQNSHSAEADCLSLLICAMKFGDSFIHWADANASPLIRYAIDRK